MNLKKALGREKKVDEDVNIIPIMNIFLILIPFLLLFTAFIKLAILEISLPSLGKGGKSQQEQNKEVVLIILAIKETGFQLKSPGFKFDPINKNNDNYNYNVLDKQLKQIKDQHATAEDIIISPEGKVKYDIIIKTMDQCRERGFPNVSLAG